jgi:hypothetical protein
MTVQTQMGNHRSAKDPVWFRAEQKGTLLWQHRSDAAK